MGSRLEVVAVGLGGEIREGKPLDLRTSPLIRRVLGFEGELAVRSLKRDRKKYRTTVLSLMISIILFVAAAACRGSANGMSGD
jgi:putative ABC transport system permease protein